MSNSNNNNSSVDQQHFKSFSLTATCNSDNSETIVTFSNGLTLNINSPSTTTISPLELQLASLCACENITLKYILKTQQEHYPFVIKEMNYKKVEGIIDTRGFRGELDTESNNEMFYSGFVGLNIECEIRVDKETTTGRIITQEDINKLKEQVEKQCPIHAMYKLLNNKCKINSQWKLIE
ncbi:hypothetical protein ABK040_002369 [Willaertia magna]